MSDRVSAAEIEQIVGARRDQTRHLGRLDEVVEMIYILHSRECLESTPDLRTCPYSLAMDALVLRRPENWPEAWRSGWDVLVLGIDVDGLLVPLEEYVEEEDEDD